MKKQLSILLGTLLLTAMVLGACGKKGSMSDGLGGSGDNPNPLADTQYKEFRYMQIMYNSETGQILNDTALSNINNSLYSNETIKQDVQNVLNKTMLFPVQSTVKSYTRGDVPWYQSIPASIDLNKFNGDLSLAMKDFINNSGKTDIINNLDKIFNNLENLQNLIDSTLSNVDINNANLENRARIEDIKNTISTSINLAVSLYTGLYAGSAFQAMDLVGGLFSGLKTDLVAEKLNLIIGKLDAIQQTLNRIEAKLNAIETKLDQLRLEAAYEPVQKARIFVNSTIPIQLKTCDENLISQFVANHILGGGADDFVQLYTTAKVQAVKALELSLDKVAYFDVPTVKITHHYLDGYPYYIYSNTLKFKAKAIVSALPVTYEDLLLLKRMSLTRLSLLAKYYKGEDLLKFRHEVIQSQDKLFLNEIKTSLNTIFTKIQTNYNNSLSFTDTNHFYNLLDEYFGYNCKSFTIDKVQKACEGNDIGILMVNNFESSYFSNHLHDDGKSLSTRPGNLTHEIIQQTLSYNAVFKIPEFRNYLIAYLAVLADWEIQLRAHAKAYGKEL